MPVDGRSLSRRVQSCTRGNGIEVVNDFKWSPARWARVHFDDVVLTHALLRVRARAGWQRTEMVEMKKKCARTHLNIALADDARVSDDFNCRLTQNLIVLITQRLAGRNSDRLAWESAHVERRESKSAEAYRYECRPDRRSPCCTQ